VTVLSLLRRFRIRAALPVLAAAVLLSACSNKQRLGQYDYRGKSLAVVTLAPAHPDIFGRAHFHVDADRPVETLIRASTELAREASAAKVRPRLDSAATRVAVAERLSQRTLQHSARHLRAVPAEDGSTSDYELEIRVRHYGIDARSWSSGAYYTVRADMMLMDGRTGRRIWKTDLRATDPIRPAAVGLGDRSVTNVLNAMALANLTTEQIERALEGLADFAADALVAELARSLDRVRR
jgi:ABC-type uncharacterized transport system auxiliary subunit